MSVSVCGDCGEVFVRQDGHRCEPTTVGSYIDALKSFVDSARRIADLERQVAELRDENARLQADVEAALHG